MLGKEGASGGEQVCRCQETRSSAEPMCAPHSRALGRGEPPPCSAAANLAAFIHLRSAEASGDALGSWPGPGRAGGSQEVGSPGKGLLLLAAGMELRITQDHLDDRDL